MYARALLTVSLLFLALPAVARDAQAVGPEGEACSADYSASTSPDADPVQAPRRAEPAKPAIPRGSSNSSPTRPPRWHSFLPGMFR